MSTHHIHPARIGGVVVAMAIIIVTVLVGWRQMRTASLNPLSQEAVLTADVVHISPSVAGRIVELAVRENDAVSKGDVLFRLDPTSYQLAVDQAAGDLLLAEALLGDREREIRAEIQNAAIADGQVARARENLALASETLRRLLPLRPKGYVSEQEVDMAATAERDAQISLREAERQAEAAEALVGNSAGAAALVEARRAALAIAQHALESTVVRAPHDGRIAGLTITAGEFVLPGQSIFTLIDTSRWYASASFVETELSRIKPGTCATVYALADRHTPVRGRVEGTGWGVASEDIVNLPRSLPLIPRSLDWVRIAQRFPVRILLDDPPEELMRVGGSATVTVHDGTSC